MRVLQVIAALSSGGAEAFAAHLSLALANEGAEVRVFLMVGVRRERGRVLLQRLQDAGIQVEGIEERRPATLRNLLNLARTIVSWKPDVVHSHLYCSEVACALVRLLLPNPNTAYIRTMHSRDVRGVRPLWILRLLGRLYQCTVSCSSSVGEAYRLHVAGSAAERTRTIQNGQFLPDEPSSQSERAAARRALGLVDGAFVVAHVGRMETVAGAEGLDSNPKGQDILVRSFATAFSGDSACILLLAGDGSLRSELEALSCELGVSAQVRFLGEQPEPWPALRAADLFCLPSRYEGLPLVLLEAASCGLPVVASDIPEVRAVEHGDAWRLVAVGDSERFAEAMMAARRDLEASSRTARQNARHFREEYSMDTCARSYIRCYERVLARRPDTSGD